MKTEQSDSFRSNLRLFIHEVNSNETQVKEPSEKLFDKLKDKFASKGMSIFLLTKETYRELRETLDAAKNEIKTLKLNVRHLDPQKFKTENDYNRLDRLVIFNQKDNTLSFVTISGDQKPSVENVQIVLKTKNKETEKSEGQVIASNIQAKKMSEADYESMNQIVVSIMANMHTTKPDETSLLQTEMGEVKAITSTRGGRSKDSRNTAESSTNEEKDLPASEREEFVEAPEKIQKELNVVAREIRELEKSGEKRREEFLRNKSKVDTSKDQHRARVAREAIKSQRRRKVQGI